MFKRFTNVALTYGWLERNPFAGYTIKTREKERGYLTQDEIEAISAKNITIPRIEQVRDIFIFSCYTGLAYADVKKLTAEHLTNGIDGQKWIVTNRTKTDKRSAIPLLPQALVILEKYKAHIEQTGMLLPVLSNQRMNSYLKEVGDICGITKVLTFHLARHSFATSIALTNGVPIETVSKMLGHTNLKTTQIYAKVVDTKISQDMERLKEKLN
jgi:integrase